MCTTTTTSTVTATTTTSSTSTRTSPISSPIPKGPGKKRETRLEMTEDYDLIEPSDPINEMRLLNRAHFNRICEFMV